ncbi:hypothetical protein AWC38_SpisGene23074 [Stylophora pistillata]|uniref:Uncharacterized protein n=1 Tax=Stylophora pistillata TaxID=50429 RepID=A0A2B4R962_STYPI|nr:hypothetical protein AWC38_SpisGene23074 [Stylophora pistillata]
MSGRRTSSSKCIMRVHGLESFQHGCVCGVLFAHLPLTEHETALTSVEWASEVCSYPQSDMSAAKASKAKASKKRNVDGVDVHVEDGVEEEEAYVGSTPPPSGQKKKKAKRASVSKSKQLVSDSDDEAEAEEVKESTEGMAKAGFKLPVKRTHREPTTTWDEHDKMEAKIAEEEDSVPEELLHQPTPSLPVSEYSKGMSAIQKALAAARSESVKLASSEASEDMECPLCDGLFTAHCSDERTWFTCPRSCKLLFAPEGTFGKLMGDLEASIDPIFQAKHGGEVPDCMHRKTCGITRVSPKASNELIAGEFFFICNNRPKEGEKKCDYVMWLGEETADSKGMRQLMNETYKNRAVKQAKIIERDTRAANVGYKQGVKDAKLRREEKMRRLHYAVPE